MVEAKQSGLSDVCLLQIDLRDDPKTIAKLNDMKEKPVATEQGQKLAKEVRRSHWSHFSTWKWLWFGQKSSQASVFQCSFSDRLD